MINIQFENQPVVGVYKVEPLWHLYLARPGNVQCCNVRIGQKWPKSEKMAALPAQLLEPACRTASLSRNH